MAQCKKCGKKGFFLHLDKNDLCNSCVESIRQQTLKEIRETENQINEKIHELQERNKIADEQLKCLNSAREKYEKTEEYDKLIEVYEDVFSTPATWNAASHKLRLVGYYQKCKQWDKAWLLLDSISVDYPLEITRVERYKYRQLKDQKKYDEALEAYFLYKCHECKSILCWPDVKNEEYDSFLKEASSIAKKAKLDVIAIPELADIFIEVVEDPHSNEISELDKFKAWYKKIKK